jgi:hypothetical protein
VELNARSLVAIVPLGSDCNQRCYKTNKRVDFHWWTPPYQGAFVAKLSFPVLGVSFVCYIVFVFKQNLEAPNNNRLLAKLSARSLAAIVPLEYRGYFRS